MSMGGYVAEKMIFGDITTGPSSDLQVATNLARAMVTRWGMSDVIGPVALASSGGKREWGESVDKEYSETISTKIDEEVRRIIDDGIKSAEKVLLENRKALDAIANKLIEVETLEKDEYEKVIIAYGIMPKRKRKLKLLKVFISNILFISALSSVGRAVRLYRTGPWFKSKSADTLIFNE